MLFIMGYELNSIQIRGFKKSIVFVDSDKKWLKFKGHFHIRGEHRVRIERGWCWWHWQVSYDNRLVTQRGKDVGEEQDIVKDTQNNHINSVKAW